MTPYPESPGFVLESDTSREASATLDPHVARELVARFVVDHGTATCEEVELGLSMRHQTASARIRELVLKGRLRDTGRKKVNRTGRRAVEYEPCSVEPGQVALPRIKPCRECGVAPVIDGSYEENEGHAFDTLRILHMCSKSTEWVSLTSQCMTPRRFSEQELRRRLIVKWNRIA